MSTNKATVMLITVRTVISMEAVSNKLIIVCDFVNDHSKALNALFHKL